MTNATLDCESVGHIASSLRCTVSQVKRIAEELKLHAAMVLNDVVYFTSSDATLIGEHLAAERQKKQQ